LICSILLVIVLSMPRLGGAHNVWINGIYESVIILFAFPLIVYFGAGGVTTTRTSTRICKFFGDISYPLYISHYPLIYTYTGWVSDHKGVGFRTALPYAAATFVGAIVIAYASLKLYDEPVRKWLQKRN